MKSTIFSALLGFHKTMKIKRICFLIFTLITCQISFAQTYDTVGFKSESESRYEYIAAKFEKENRQKIDTWNSICERRFIQKGDSTRIFFFFNPSYIKSIEIEGGPVVASKK